MFFFNVLKKRPEPKFEFSILKIFSSKIAETMFLKFSGMFLNLCMCFMFTNKIAPTRLRLQRMIYQEAQSFHREMPDLPKHLLEQVRSSLSI